MKKIIFIIIAVISFNTGSKAQLTDKKEAIKELFNVMHQDSLITKSMREMAKAMSGSLQNRGLNDSASNNHMEQLMEKQMAATKIMVTRMVNEDMVDIYDKYFTLQEIKDFTNFYKSKSGQQLLNKSTEITKDLMMIMTSKYLPDMQKSMKESERTN